MPSMPRLQGTCFTGMCFEMQDGGLSEAWAACVFWVHVLIGSDDSDGQQAKWALNPVHLI